MLLRLGALLGSVLLSGCVIAAHNLDRGPRWTQGGMATAPIAPLAAPSDEATASQLQLAREQGMAADSALQFWLQSGCASSGRMAAGEYQVAYSLRPPQGTWVSRNGALQWQPPSGNALLAVVVLDGADQRPIPGLAIRAQIRRVSGEAVATQQLAYRWGVPLEEYAAALTLPAGELRIRLDIEPPGFLRHDPINGDRFAEPAFAEFTSVWFDPQRLAHAPSEDPARALELAKLQGQSLARAYAEMSSAVANDGAQVLLGDYRVAYAVEFAETYWHMCDGHLRLNLRPEQSTETNAHVEIAVLDALTGRFLPGLDVWVTLVDADGQVVGTESQHFMWHPWMHHYGRNWRIPGSGHYRLRVHVAPPAWPRAGVDPARRFAQPVDVEFPNVRMLTGQK